MSAWRAGAALLVALAACASGPVHLDRSELGPGPAPPAAAESVAPHVWVDRLVDQRGDSSLGAVAGRPFHSTEVPAWIESELARLRSPGFAVVTGSPPDPAARLRIRPRLLKAYVDSVANSKTAVIVLGVELATAGGQAVQRLYRGQHVSLNWASSGPEVVEALQQAAASCLEQLRVDVELRLHPDRQPPPRTEPPAER